MITLSEQDISQVINDEFAFIPHSRIIPTSDYEGYFSHEIVSDNYKIIISYSPIRLEFSVDILFGNETFNLEELIGYDLLKDIPEKPEVSLYRVYQERDIGGFRKLINYFVCVLESNLGYILDNSQRLLGKVSQIRERNWVTSSNHDLILQAAHNFRIKNWNGVVESLEKVQGELSELNKKRLEFCKSRING